ncbi:hypothetical protein ANOM_003987 [Aspergillus nomiae NRRL 13137]|uniref:Fungal-type protein kinase domain-containing protein n=1 Tax=Aspergillus nomiae NRRL (strain ATCC 15546 / NRRL 13137 / CBS 260.88 / M93) TaxID=1509407 RepID=A0A0L1J345_ASPN3|nr:uncharacterized protein ANOM_003987 [Aspergillus nomiae NRRL 13137]KNG85848.1 hypothetical protein ANOM_003987 [Aspergillus nomiae NRRL 13137]
MSSCESSHHKELRDALRAIKKDVEGLETYQLDYSQLKTHQIYASPMDLDESSSVKPRFFRPCDASLLIHPDATYDQTWSAYSEFDSIDPSFRRPINCARWVMSYFSSYIVASAICSKDFILDELWSGVSTSDEPWRGLWEDEYPEYGTIKAHQVKDRSSPHMKAMLYNNLDGKDGELLRGEILVALRLVHTQMRRRCFFEHMTTPVLLFSFMGPQHARVIEAYFSGISFVMRTTPLFDLRKKDEALVKTFGQWYLGEPTGNTKQLLKL